MTEDTTETGSPKTLEELLRLYSSTLELAESVDRAMLYMILLLKYEPESMEMISSTYENLYELRNVILNHPKPNKQ